MSPVIETLPQQITRHLFYTLNISVRRAGDTQTPQHPPSLYHTHTHPSRSGGAGRDTPTPQHTPSTTKPWWQSRTSRSTATLATFGNTERAGAWKHYFFFFISVLQRGQYHFPFGFVVRLTHAKWNHSIGHCTQLGVLVILQYYH